MEQTQESRRNGRAAVIASKKHVGGCHCGAVRFEATIQEGAPLSRCNCSICTKIGQAGIIVKPSAFTLVAGKEHLGSYAWGAKISTRYFCKHCGIHCYGAGFLAEIGGEFVSVNANCFDDFELTAQKVIYWDGRHDNWQAGPSETPWPITAKASVAS